jgi:hypothetical protein
MKKLFFILFFLTFFGLLIFADTEPEEVGSLLFLPDSSTKFANEEQARIQLDNAAEYLLGKIINPGQIRVQGYAAVFVNQIESTDISRDRALFVINELQKRGIPNELFSEPIGYGAVDLWGSNANETDRSPNRRVRILLEGTTQALQENVDTEIEIEEAEQAEEVQQEMVQQIEDVQVEEVQREEFAQKNSSKKSRSKFPWMILLLLLVLAALLFLLSKFLKKTTKQDTVSKPAIIKVAASGSATAGVVVKDLYEEILFLAYELYLGRKSYGMDEDPDADWHRAVFEVCAKYEANGYDTYAADGSWWAQWTVKTNNEQRDNRLSE